jgi:hypothetical protein
MTTHFTQPIDESAGPAPQPAGDATPDTSADWVGLLEDLETLITTMQAQGIPERHITPFMALELEGLGLLDDTATTHDRWELFTSHIQAANIRLAVEMEAANVARAIDTASAERTA